MGPEPSTRNSTGGAYPTRISVVSQPIPSDSARKPALDNPALSTDNPAANPWGSP